MRVTLLYLFGDWSYPFCDAASIVMSVTLFKSIEIDWTPRERKICSGVYLHVSENLICNII